MPAFNPTADQGDDSRAPDPTTTFRPGMGEKAALVALLARPRPPPPLRVRLLTLSQVPTAERSNRVTSLSRGTAEAQSAPIIFICGRMQGIGHRRVTGIRLTTT